MSTPTTKFQLDLGSIEEELNRAMLSISQEEVQNEIPPDPNLSIEAKHLLMAQQFVEYELDPEFDKSVKLAKQLEKKERRKEVKRQTTIEQDSELAKLEAVYDLFCGNYSYDIIKRLLKEHNNDFNSVIEELIKASTSRIKKDFNISSGKKVITVVASPSSRFNVNNLPSKKSSSELLEEITQDDAIAIADEYARRLNSASKHHYDQAWKFGTRNPLFGPLTAIAREEKEKAFNLEDKADKEKAKKICNSLDLHGIPVYRALRFTNATINSILERKPGQKKLEVITGKGTNSINRKPIMKTAVIQWLNQMKIKYELIPENPGTVIVHLSSK